MWRGQEARPAPSVRLAELGSMSWPEGWQGGRDAPVRVELCVYLPLVLVLGGAAGFTPQQPGPNSPTPSSLSSPMSLLLVPNPQESLPSPAQLLLWVHDHSVISRPVSLTRWETHPQGPPCDRKTGRHGHLACSGFAWPGGWCPPPCPAPSHTWACSHFLLLELAGAGPAGGCLAARCFRDGPKLPGERARARDETRELPRAGGRGHRW